MKKGTAGHQGDHKPDHALRHSDHYVKLLLMVGLSFGAMYILMYSMVNAYADVYNNVNQVYMAGLLAAPMITIELMVMRAMYRNKQLNAVLIGVSLLAAAVFFFGIRRQAGVSDDQFLRSMIPHHSSAILMCQEAHITDSRIKELCGNIVTGQREEINQMKSLLAQ
jgi:uncharacterized protein (DUF305 family)